MDILPCPLLPQLQSQSFREFLNEVVEWTEEGGVFSVFSMCTVHSSAGHCVCVRCLLRRDHNESCLSVSDSPLEDPDLKDSYLIPRNIMAEPDYIEDDNPELIRPQKLVNPVKTSRNHQDLHRELLMNQKR